MEIQGRPAAADAEHVETREGYDRWAAIYDDESNPLIRIETPVVAALLGDVGGLDVIDVGCGTGRHAIALAAAGARVTGVDFSTNMLAKARGRLEQAGARLIEYDIRTPLPFEDRSFDRVLSALVIDHIPDLRAFFGELGRVCRADGFIVLSVMHPAMMLRGVRARFTDPMTGRETRPESHEHQIADYVLAAARSGLEIDDIREHAMTAEIAADCPRARRYVGWPILLAMRLRSRAG